MTEKWLTAVISVALAVVGLAALAVLLSRNSQTSTVITGGAGAFKNALCAALSPIGVNCGTISLTPDVNSTITFPSGSTTFPDVNSTITYPSGSTTFPGVGGAGAGGGRFTLGG
jgi:hypothetical protein